ncbi:MULTISPECIES: hypothetical protein [unclassified Nocardia]|uniref:hypothetical protein n=1 Tax=unclassified Nocardia TaxID=2637762 RepID=UPI001CE44879|nr:MULTISPECIES: hypothetical protein [unclassified Nocardia]
MEPHQCHVHLSVEDGLTFDYRAEPRAAYLFARDVGALLGAEVTIDDQVHDGLPPLPCACLWSSR